MLKITSKQNKKVWAKSRETGMSEDRLRYVVERITGKRSIKALTTKQAIRVINVLEGKSYLPAPRNSNVIALATPWQLSKIESLKEAAGWTDEHLMNFIKRYKREDLRKLRRSEAGVVIHVLNKAVLKKREVT